jgi:hypothetical protein
MLMVNLELALITPPVGMNLFVIKGITDAPLSEVIRGALPYVLLLIAGLVLIWAVPALSLWLPGKGSRGCVTRTTSCCCAGAVRKRSKPWSGCGNGRRKPD